jgi:hypothetical protein
VPTQFRFEHVFRAPSVRTLIDAYFDLDHSVFQDKVAQLTDRVVVESTDTETLRKVSWRVASLRPLPVIARPFVAGGRLSFQESMSWDARTPERVDMSVSPEILGGRVQITGAYQLSMAGEGQVRRMYEGQISAGLRLVGGRIERGILEAFTEQMPAMADCTQRWLDGKA